MRTGRLGSATSEAPVMMSGSGNVVSSRTVGLENGAERESETDAKAAVVTARTATDESHRICFPKIARI